MKPKNKIVINSKSYRVLIITCWAVYIACFIIKLCGANIFEIACSNQNFINICNYVDNTMWLKMTLACIMSLILNSFMLFAMLREKFYTWQQALVFVPLIIAMSIVGWYQPYVQLALNIFCAVICPFFFKAKWYNVLIGNILVIIFQLMSLFTKNVGNIHINENNFLVSTILQIDMLIMIALYYLYSNSLKIRRKEGK